MGCYESLAGYRSLVTQKIAVEIMMKLDVKGLYAYVNKAQGVAKWGKALEFVLLITPVFEIEFPLILDHRSL